jgi:hypothetical protein
VNTAAKLLLLAIGLCAAAFVLDLVAIFVVAVVTSDQGVRAAERAAVFLLGFEAVIALAASATFWIFARDLNTWPRLFATLAALIPQAAIAVMMAFFSLLALNR